MRSLTQERLRELLDYNSSTGVFRWRVNRKGGPRAGDIAGSTNKKIGYRVHSIDGVLYYGHVLAWFWLHDEWPEMEIDHRNLDRTDNSEDNLRLAKKSQQRANQTVRVDSILGVKGVSRTPAGRYSTKFLGKYVGTFNTIEEAAEAYRNAAERHFGEYARS